MRSWRLLAAFSFALLWAIPASADDPAPVPAGASLDSVPVPSWKTIDLAPFYPAGMERIYPDDVEGQTLEQFLAKFEQVTGIAIRLDREQLVKADVNVSHPIKKRVAGLPSFIALGRVLEDIPGQEVDWIEKDGGFWLTSIEEVLNHQHVSTLEIGPLLDRGYDTETLRSLAYRMTTGPWREIDGDGGKVRVLGDRMTVMQSSDGIREMQVLLTALASNEPVIALYRTPADERVRDALAKPVTAEFKDIPLTTVVDKLGRQAGIIIELASEDAGGDTQVSLNVRDRPLKEALKELLKDVNGEELETLIEDGVLKVASFAKADRIHEVRIYDIPEVAERGDTQALITLIQEMTSGPWQEIDGDGGTIESPRPRTLIVRQQESGQEEVEQLIAIHRGGKIRPKSAGKVIEVKRYRVQAQMAEDLIPLIPRFVAPGEWGDFPDGTSPTVERVSQGSEVILVIRQTQPVHVKIEKFISDLITTPAFQAGPQPPQAPQGGGFF
jgi:hypothetical protein